ncbi:calcium-translocating P-type ATPase, PMCA-type [Flavonifractor sp. An135]|nr:calcium-translocating P-type ATPase, PMCA-type [Flavonifractor sp. An135]OUQ25995.1 calcium-translocating P-type ATPase, PMCA-type [Flavonifractor sp. An135]
MGGWHTKSSKEVLRELESEEKRGLSPGQIPRRRAQYGPNTLASHKPPSLPARLLAQLKDPMVLVLLGAAGLSLAASGGSDWLDAAIILLIVVVNACISLSQEDNARRALEALRQLSAPLARVVRGGEELRVEASELVPGDIVELEAGDLVPADGRLLESAGLRCDESALTGESAPVSKDAGAILAVDAPLAERKNLVLSSTVVTAGRGRCVVVATGMDTEVGRIAGMLLGEETSDTPLQRRMGEVSRTLSFLCVCVCAVMFGVGLLFHRSMLDMFLTAVSLAVAAIPEGLPAVVTIVLALGVSRMVRRGAIIKRLPAVETLGCAGVICSDKTGTLTQNRMTVTQVWTPRSDVRRELLTAAALCTDAALRYDAHGAAVCTGDPTEVALVELAAREGFDKNRLEQDFPRRGELPFDSQRKRMSTLHPRKGGGYRLVVKGAPDVLLSRCRVDGETRQAALAANAAMAEQALRVLGVAYRDLEFLPRTLEPETVERDLTFLGLLGMMDPPRPQVRGAVEQCYAAGIRPVMITGDHKLTALAVAKELDIFRPGDLAITGEDLDFMPQEVLEQDVERFSVYARVSPEHKMRIVRAWQARGKVVAMTGDGVNDAPALKAADIGCAMGRSGTDVAKEAADMILTDDDFSTIVHAVEEGRGIYANIRKAIHYLLSCNIGEILAVFLGTLLDLRPAPLVPVQLLWLNLVTDSLPALALGVEPVEDGVMTRPPRSAHAPLFDRAFSLRLLWQGALIGLAALGAYTLGCSALLSPLGREAGSTMAFATLTLAQLFHAYDVRSGEHTLLRLGVLSNRSMNRAFLAGTALQLAVLCLPPLQTVFRTVPLTVEQWLAVAGLALAPALVCEAVKAVSPREITSTGREKAGTAVR